MDFCSPHSVICRPHSHLESSGCYLVRQESLCHLSGGRRRPHTLWPSSSHRARRPRGAKGHFRGYFVPLRVLSRHTYWRAGHTTTSTRPPPTPRPHSQLYSLQLSEGKSAGKVPCIGRSPPAIPSPLRTWHCTCRTLFSYVRWDFNPGSSFQPIR